MTLNEGTRLGRYEILALAGAGGMGQVYRARDTRLDRTVAIKVLPVEVADDPQWQARFEREARSVSALNHPRICSLYDVGEDEGTHFLVMEYLEGETLASRLARESLSLDQALEIARQIADALAAAHRAGVVHRDLKPGNVMLTRDGAKLLDFGLAKPLQESGAATVLTMAPTATSPLTAAGSVIGTFQYMAPEVLEGGEADSRSDIFAFGALLHEMVTGQRAFDGKTQASVVASILKEEPRPLSATSPSTPAALDRLVRRCLAKDPDQRWQSTTDLAQELAWIARGDEGVADPTRAAESTTPRTARWAWGAALLFALLAVVLGTLLLGRTPSGPSPFPVRFEITPPVETLLRSMDEAAAPVEVSPDGRRVVFGLSEPDGTNRLWIRSLDDPVARPLPGTEGGMRPFWSPDSRSVAFFTTTALLRVDVDGSPPLRLCASSTGRGGAWNADGTIVFAPSGGEVLYRVSDRGGEPEPVTVFGESPPESSHRYPHFLPDGRHFTYLSLSPAAAAGTGSESENRLMVGSLDGMQPRLLMAGVSQASWAAGFLVFRRGEALQARPFDAERLEFTGDAVTVSEAVQYDAGYERAIFSATDDVIAFVGGSYRGETVMQLRDRSGAVTRRFDDTVAYQMRYSPDGRTIAARTVDPQGEAISLFDLERGVRTRLTFGEGIQTSPVWSPDGERLAFSSGAVQSTIQVVRVDGDGGATALLEGVDAVPLEWSPDGRSLLVFAGEPEQFDIQRLDLDDPEPRLQPLLTSAQHNEGLPAISPDGRWLAYTSDETGRFEVYLTSFPEVDGKWQVSSEGGLDPIWNPEGTSLFYRSLGSSLMEVDLDPTGASPRLGTPEALFSARWVNDLEASTYDVSPDGQQFATAVLPEESVRTPITVVVNWTAGLE